MALGGFITVGSGSGRHATGDDPSSLSDSLHGLSRLPARVHRKALRIRERLALRSGEMSRLEPLCRNFGFTRGMPIDRHYIERFLAEHSTDVRGCVIEIGDDNYSRQFGGNRIAEQHVLDLRWGPGVTIVGDLTQPDALPPAAFDCIILTQVLDLIFDLHSAVRNLRQGLKPGGVLLVTVCGVAPVAGDEATNSYAWSFREGSLRRLLESSFDPDQITVESFGNLFAASAFLHGAAVQDVQVSRLAARDPAYPVTIAARAVA